MELTVGSPTSNSGSPRVRRVLILAPRVVASFTRQDADLLSEEFEVRLHPYPGPRGTWELDQLIRWAEVVLVWFVGRHAIPATVLARLHRRPIAAVTGGFEAAWIPEIQYGIRPGSLRHRVLGWVLGNCHRILPVSECTKRGLLKSWPGLSDRMAMIYNGVNVSEFLPGKHDRSFEVLTVGFIDAGTIETKGWRLYWEVAAKMPDVPFLAVGPAVDETARRFVSQCPPNLQWLGPLYGEDLVSVYQRASVYFQGSWHESFSVSLAESMACGCIPAVAQVGAIPEVAGDVGFYLTDRSVPAAVAAIRAALAAPPSHRIEARERIVDNFSSTRRGNLLRAEIRRILETDKATRKGGP